MNFAEAALLIQGSTCVYSKKVSLLSHIFVVYSFPLYCSACGGGGGGLGERNGSGRGEGWSKDGLGGGKGRLGGRVREMEWLGEGEGELGEGNGWLGEGGVGEQRVEESDCIHCNQ